MVLHKRGVDPHTANFATTEAGKPYIAHPTLQPLLAYNVAHDNALVVISFSPNAHNPPAYSLGIDVMKVHLPRRDTFATFIEAMTEVLTPLERRRVAGGRSDSENLRRFFWTWTMKEAYTKAVGLGLGFNFRRVEYDAEASTLRIDGKRALGWQFNKFTVQVCEDIYLGVVAQYVGGDELTIVEESTELPNYIEVYDAVSFIEHALQQLGH
ncbi:hypothetical protein AX15_001294 [Amanita polypyramis BW_CC]|nr:hypothetical protein AX15_001294 [Amanita polypyramis BW_CC]